MFHFVEFWEIYDKEPERKKENPSSAFSTLSDTSSRLNFIELHSELNYETFKKLLRPVLSP